jgi:xylulokinase
MLYTLEKAPKPVMKFLFIAGYICYRLTGLTMTDVSLACRTLLYDVEKGCWSQELLEAAGISESQLPTVVQPGTLLGGLLPGMAQELGLPEGVQVVIGTHDQIVNALGAGVAALGDAVDTSGTCECITPLFPAIPETLDFQRNNFACVPYLEGRGYVTYAYNISAGSVVRWCRDALAAHLKEEGRSVYAVLNEAAPGEGYLTIKALESFEKAADGQATKIIIPSEIQGIAGLAASLKEIASDKK